MADIRTAPPQDFTRRIGVGFISTHGQPDSKRIQFWITSAFGNHSHHVTPDEAVALATDLLAAAREMRAEQVPTLAVAA